MGSIGVGRGLRFPGIEWHSVKAWYSFMEHFNPDGDENNEH